MEYFKVASNAVTEATEEEKNKNSDVIPTSFQTK
jgi:hypothetical protein